MNVEIILNGLALIMFFGFFAADLVAFSLVDKQKEITIYSRYGRQTGPLEIIYVNVAFLLVAGMLYIQNYRFLPAILTFVILIFLNSRMKSGISPIGVFIGGTYLDWGKIESYKIINDEISTVQVRVYAYGKQYVLRCDKENRSQIDAYFIEHSIPDRV